MPNRGAAFFDLDNTLIRVKTMFSFQQYYFSHGCLPDAALDRSYAEFISRLATVPADDRSALNRLFYQSFRDRSRREVRMLAQRWFAALSARALTSLWIESSLALAQRLRLMGHMLVAVTGACEDFVAPVLAHLHFDACIGTQLEVEGDRYTGALLPPQTIGQGKAQAMRHFAVRHQIELSECTACGDHITDLPMLEAVGEAYIVAGDPQLEALAQLRGWPILTDHLITAGAPAELHV